MDFILLVHLAASMAMAGIIWSVQWVQYPLFLQVGADDFDRYHQLHMSRIGPVVGPLMVVEVASGIALLWFMSAVPPAFIASLALLAIVWLSTFAIQVPLHRQLSSAWSGASVRALIRSNWIRTAAWTARVVLLLSVVSRW